MDWQKLNDFKKQINAESIYLAWMSDGAAQILQGWAVLAIQEARHIVDERYVRRVRYFVEIIPPLGEDVASSVGDPASVRGGLSQEQRRDIG